MEGNFVTIQEHKEFARRQDAENERQNRCIADLGEKVERIHSLAISMERMSANIEKMTEAIERQGNLIEKQTIRIDEIEKEPAKDYKQIKMAIVTTVIGAVVGAAVGAVLMLL